MHKRVVEPFIFNIFIFISKCGPFKSWGHLFYVKLPQFLFYPYSLYMVNTLTSNLHQFDDGYQLDVPDLTSIERQTVAFVGLHYKHILLYVLASLQTLYVI